MRRTRLRVLALGIAALIGVACGDTPPANIVLVTLDTLRRDHVGAYGDPTGLTPHLDALAREGIVHDAAYTTMPTTGPAHASLFTGLAPHQHGVMRNGVRMPEAVAPLELATRLKEAGYATAAFVTGEPMTRRAFGARGFDHYDEPARGVFARPGVEAVNRATVWLSNTKQRPAFVFVHLYDAHSPYGEWREKRREPKVDWSRYGFVDRKLYARPAQRAAMSRRYAQGVDVADRALGSLVEAARATLDDPLFVLVSDHGEALDEHLDTRGYGYDHGEFLDADQVLIPLVLAGPGVERGRSPGIASIRDLYTTVLAAAGITDEGAALAGRRDLRRISRQGRAAHIERLAVTPGWQRRFGARASALVMRHAAAVAAPERLVIVGENGEATDRGIDADDLVLADARLLLAERKRALDAATGATPVDPAVRQALEALGYVEGDAPGAP